MDTIFTPIEDEERKSLLRLAFEKPAGFGTEPSILDKIGDQLNEAVSTVKLSLKNFKIGYNVGKCAIDTAFEARRLGVSDLFYVDERLDKNFRDDLHSAQIMFSTIYNYGPSASCGGLFCSLLFNPLSTYFGLHSYQKKKKQSFNRGQNGRTN